MKGGFIDTPTGAIIRKNAGYDDTATMIQFVKYILVNSVNIKILSMSSLYGIVYQIKLPVGVASPVALHEFTSCECQFTAFRDRAKPRCEADTFLDTNFTPQSPSCLKDVTTFILKLALTGATKDASYVYLNPSTGQNLNKAIETLSGFTEESAAQYEIYNKEFNSGLSIVPPVISSQSIAFNYTDKHIQGAIEFFVSKLPQFDAILRAGSRAKYRGIPAPATGFAFIPMFFADGYETIFDIQNSPRYSYEIKEKARVLGAWAICRLALVYHKTHGDEHMGNVMVNVNSAGEFLKTTDEHKFELGKVLIIDLGRTSVIPDRIYRQIISSPNQLYTLMNYEIQNIARNANVSPMDVRQYHWPLGPGGYTGSPLPLADHNTWFQKVQFVEKRYTNTVAHLNKKLLELSHGVDFTHMTVDEYNKKLNKVIRLGAGRRNTKRNGRKLKKNNKRTLIK